MAVANAMCALCTHEIDANSVQEGLASVLTAAAMEALLPIDDGAGCFVPPAKQAIQAKFVFLCVSATTCSRHAQDCGANPPPTLDHLARVCKKRDGRLNALEQVLMPEQYDASEWFANVHVLSTPPAPATPDGEGGGEQAGAALTSIEGTGTGADAHGQVVGTGTGADSLADGLIGGAAAIAADGPAAATTLGTADGAAGGAADGASAGPSDGIGLEAANCATEGAPGGASDGAIDGANKGEGGGEAEVWGWRRKKSPVEKEAAAKAAAATAALGAAEKKSVETYNAAAQATNERQVATREGNPNSEATMLLAIANEKKAKQAAADASAAKLAAEKAAEAAHNAAVQATYDIEDAAEKVASEKAAAEKAAAEKAAAEKAAAEKAAAEEAAAEKAAAEKAAAEEAAAEKGAAVAGDTERIMNALGVSTPAETRRLAATILALNVGESTTLEVSVQHNSADSCKEGTREKILNAPYETATLTRSGAWMFELLPNSDSICANSPPWRIQYFKACDMDAVQDHIIGRLERGYWRAAGEDSPGHPHPVSNICNSAILYPGKETAGEIKYETSAFILKKVFGSSLHPFKSGAELAHAIQEADSNSVDTLFVMGHGDVSEIACYPFGAFAGSHCLPVGYYILWDFGSVLWDACGL